MFSPRTYAWMADLADHNDRSWFAAHKGEYEAAVRAPALRFIEAVAPGLGALSPEVRCDARALFRGQRDTRFSTDKTPYKTHVGLHFRHRAAADVHAPGFYLHLANEGNFFGAGIWRPDGPTLAKLRADMLERPEGWTGLALGSLVVGGESLKRPPRGVAPGHPAEAWLRRKDLIAMADVATEEVLGEGVVEGFVARCREAAPLMARLCAALGLPW